MIHAIITDFSRVLLFPKNNDYSGGLNELNNQLLKEDPNYKFLDFFILNNELLSYYSKLKKMIPVYIFTSETIQDHPSIKEKLENSSEGVFSALKLGIHKSKPSAYGEVLRMLSLKPEEVVYIDDRQENLDAASRIGTKTILYTNNKTTTNKLDLLIANS